MSESPSSAATEAIDAQRREPFGKSPTVRARGRATQQKLLNAALELFAENGYQVTSVEAITDRAGCSRPTFYQYFESKDDLFRRLAGRFGESLAAVLDSLTPVDATTEGLEVIRRWFEELQGVHDQYLPIANAFAASLQRDSEMVSGARHLADRYGQALAKAVENPLDSDVELEQLSTMVMTTTFGALNIRSRQRRPIERQRVVGGVADAVHRCFFGKHDDVNYGPESRHFGRAPDPRPVPAPVTANRELRPKGERTRASLLNSANRMFSELGYHRTRVDDIVEAASLSHGAFYRYFDDKEAVFSELALVAAADIVEHIDRLPLPSADLPAWCDSYYDTYAAHGPLFAMWPEATEAGVRVGLEVSRAVATSLQGVLAERPFGDVQVDSLFLFALLENGPRASASYGALSGAHASRATALILDRALLAH